MSSIRINSLDHRWMNRLQTNLHTWWRLILRGGGESTTKEKLNEPPNRLAGLGVGPASPLSAPFRPIFCRQVGPLRRVIDTRVSTLVDVGLYT
jgi:hypothetical protein